MTFKQFVDELTPLSLPIDIAVVLIPAVVLAWVGGHRVLESGGVSYPQALVLVSFVLGWVVIACVALVTLSGRRGTD